MGLPAIVSDVPGQVDAIKENETGLTCTVKDSRSLEKAMGKLIENVELRMNLGNKLAGQRMGNRVRQMHIRMCRETAAVLAQVW